ncbi:Rieske 2Fe-2S domain-containing protein [Carboxydochorda subterranea]|uniref:Rieske 2Fe-2S domain-containing protein n=1 Tax=Carboxydichorda subterranea TaxID=3109565 RepID=A0ABZ1BUV7_9FIRM|nr:Rieske 2Fe-2S domain-containing protein [Limnochorda sp. L945t]WRP16433.1 Rieske 2Fe-2S domain-containing protein [Limnochorda sp. L945t]
MATEEQPARKAKASADGREAGAPGAARRSLPPVERVESPEVKRRIFMRWVMWGSAFLFFAQSAAASLAMFWPRKVVGFGTKMDVGPVSAFPVNSVTKFAQGKFWLSRTPQGAIALYWRCTHLGCTVPWREDEQLFHCPCHGSIYERNGQNIAGPAPRPLDYMTVEVVNGHLVVNTGEIHERAVALPQHMTPV